MVTPLVSNSESYDKTSKRCYFFSQFRKLQHFGKMASKVKVHKCLVAPPPGAKVARTLDLVRAAITGSDKDSKVDGGCVPVKFGGKSG